MTNSNIEAFANRVSLLLSENNSASDFARKVGVSDTVVRKWRDGKSDPSRENLVSIARVARVNIEWLATGEGPMRGDGGVGADRSAGLFNSEEAQKKLLNINAAIEANYDKIQKNPSKFNELRADLERIALQESLDDPTRAQADNLLYLIFEDASAGQRREARFSKVAIQMKERIALVQQAVDMAGVEVSPTILELVKTLVLPGEPDASDIARLLKAIAAQSQNI